jgi:hypothetical protein
MGFDRAHVGDRHNILLGRRALFLGHGGVIQVHSPVLASDVAALLRSSVTGLDYARIRVHPTIAKTITHCPATTSHWEEESQGQQWCCPPLAHKHSPNILSAQDQFSPTQGHIPRKRRSRTLPRKTPNWLAVCCVSLGEDVLAVSVLVSAFLYIKDLETGVSRRLTSESRRWGFGTPTCRWLFYAEGENQERFRQYAWDLVAAGVLDNNCHVIPCDPQTETCATLQWQGTP